MNGLGHKLFTSSRFTSNQNWCVNLGQFRNDIKNFFSQKGYIFDAKKNKDDLIIKTTLGSDSGAIEGNKVVIYTKREYINQVSKKKEVIELKMKDRFFHKSLEMCIFVSH